MSLISSAIAVNGRFRQQPLSGVQRVAAQYLAHMKSKLLVVEPTRPLGGIKGHLWEQLLLPRLAGDRLLWSPCNTGPIANARQVVTIHDMAVFDHPEWFSREFRSLYHLVLPRLARLCLRVVTVSEFSRTRIVDCLGLNQKKVEVIWNGVGGNFSPRSEAEVAAVKKQLGLDDAPFFLSLSTIEPRKNLQLVLRAWSIARPHLPKGMRLLIAGRKGASSIFRETDSGTQEEDTSISTLGFVDDAILPALLTGAHAVLYPSLYEGFGLPIAEAMACGTTVITTARTSLPEVAGDAAIYVDVIDPADLARQILNVAGSADCRMEYSGRGIARAKLFSWPDAATRMDGILESLA